MCARLDGIEKQMKLFFSSGVASALLSPTVQHFSNLAQQYQFAMQAPQNQPVVNQPVVNQPVVNQPGVNQPVVNQPGVNQPVVDQPVVNQPVVNQPVEPVVNQSANQLVSSNRTLGDANRLDTSVTSVELDTSAGTYLYLWPYKHYL